MDKKQPEVIAETAEILAMFAVIVRSYKNLSSEDRQKWMQQTRRRRSGLDSTALMQITILTVMRRVTSSN